MILRPLTTNERAETPGFTHVAVITANDLTSTTLAAAQAFDICAVKAGDIIYRAIGDPVVPFQKAGDATFNTNLVSFGDTGSTTRHLAATEANENLAELKVMGNTAYLYAANDTLRITVASQTGRSLSEINRGEYHVFFSLCRTSYVSNAVARTSPTK
jgi:hypothetical protein